MTIAEASYKITELIKKLNTYTEAYDNGHPLVSDKEYDDLYFELESLENKYNLVYPNSPTQNIHWNILSKLEKVEHNHPMLSLDKTKDIVELAKFFGGKEFVCMFKMDGLTLSLLYEDGELVRAETRGNGTIGEDVTHNAKVVKNIPQKIPCKERLVIDGEIICRKDDFQKFKDDYKNPRNFAAGSIRLLNAHECEERNLTFVAWDLVEGLQEDVVRFQQKLFKLANLGFTVVPYTISDNVEEALDAMDFELDYHDIYPTDGYVFKFSDLEYGEAQGRTEHHRKNAIALKLYDETYETELINIEWTMGRTSLLTPIAICKPVEIDGAVIERCSLHNVSVMTELLGECPYVGEPLEIARVNQIIPQVYKAGPKYDYLTVIKNKLSPLNKIEYCPICNSKVEYKTSFDGVTNAYCGNPLCEGALINRLDHFFGKKSLDVKGLSKATFEKLIAWGWIEKIEDVFTLGENHCGDWINKPGFGQASVMKILNAIDNGKKTTLSAFISAIGIPLIGQTNAKELAKKFKTYDEFRIAVDDPDYSFTSIYGFGIEMNNSLKKFDYAEADKLVTYLTFDMPAATENGNSLTGMNIVITGKLSTNRDSFKKLIEEHGGKVTSAISSKTSLLINNDINSTSSKNKTAKELGIPIVSEQQFINDYL